MISVIFKYSISFCLLIVSIVPQVALESKNILTITYLFSYTDAYYIFVYIHTKKVMLTLIDITYKKTQLAFVILLYIYLDKINNKRGQYL